jgi:[CysO sulfur-carrier protein]-S-L-cysteine hydrolase
MTPELLRLPRTLHDGLIRHARDEAPRECCGFLIGRGCRVREAVRMRNVAPAPATRYEIDPGEHIGVLRRLRGSGLEVVGVYHSHPGSPAAPSPADEAGAHYPEFVWVIVSLLPAAGEVAAFRLGHGEPSRIPVVLEP